MNKKYTLVFVLLSILANTSYAVEQDSSDRSYSPDDTTVAVSHDSESLWDRKTLTGDWGGLRTKLKNSGITIKSSWTNFYQGDEIKGKSNYEYGSQLGLTIIGDGKKLGLWDGFFIGARAQLNTGASVNGTGGTMLPVNTALAYPGISGSDRHDASFYFVQFFSPKEKVVFGKLSTIDLTNFSRYKGGSGLTRFQNVSFVSGPNGITTPSVLGAFFISESDKFNYTLAFYDSESSLNKMGLEGRFAKGTTFFASADIPVTIFGQKGKQGLMGSYSTRGDFVLLEDPYIVKNGKRYFAGYYFDQAIYTSPTNPKQNWGLFGQAIITDNDASPTNYGFVLGLAGNSFIHGRAEDTWGVGYFKYSLSDYLSSVTIPVINASPNNEYGYEAFYNYKVTHWLSVGVDAQYINPGMGRNKVTYLGLRSKIDF